MPSIPVIDVSPLLSEASDAAATAAHIREACRENGFFYISGHGVSSELQDRLEQVSRKFFAQENEIKLQLRMQLGGHAWRGYFPVGNELTSGQADQKEGIYFGAELPNDHPKVRAGVPLHGANLFPAIDGFREIVLDYLRVMTELGHVVMQGIALSLGLDATYFRARFTNDPTILFRIFHYPPLRRKQAKDSWSVGEHTDYGLLTILRQDQTSGLQVKSHGQWIEAPPIADTFVCNIGDMLDRMTGGLYRSTPHRVLNTNDRSRLSFPFFFDPNWDAEVKPLFPDMPVTNDAHVRWDRTNLHELRGTYGDYLLYKVVKVFPTLSREQLDS